MSALASLSREELQALLSDARPIEMECDYCGRQYSVGPVELQGLLQQS
jgi:redox-regulated HSP33 family molecular chaperone